MIGVLTRLTERLCPGPRRERTSGPWARWIRALERWPGFYQTLYEMRRQAAPPVELLQVHLEATNICNLRCRTCSNKEQKAPGGRMPFDLACRVIDQAHEAVGRRCILGFYIRGESTLHPQLPEMIRYARARGTQRLLLSTNLTRMDRRMAGELLGAGLSELRLSVDSADRGHFEKIRRGADFSQVCDAVAVLDEERRRLSSTCHFRLHAALGEEGFFSVPSFVRRWDAAIDCFKFTVAVNQGGLFDQPRARRLSCLDFACSNRFQIPCRLLYNYAGVTWDGKITSCCVDYDEHFVVGHIDDGLKETFQNGPAGRLREAHLAGRLGPVCSRCGFANALVDWFEDEVNHYVAAHRHRFHQPQFDRTYHDWLERSIAKFNNIASSGRRRPSTPSQTLQGG